MGRPRKLPAERLSRYVQARVTDGQWNWLEYKALDSFDGDVSKALRWCIDQSSILDGILDSPDPRKKFDELLSSVVDGWELELTMDEEPHDEKG
jgi:hypothetical protein